MGVCHLSIQVERVDGLFDLLILCNGDKALLAGFIDSHLGDITVLSSDISFDISAGRLNSEGPRSFYASFLFVAVIICSIIFMH